MMDRLSSLFLNAWVFGALLFIFAPILVILGASVTEGTHITFPPKGFSLHWYATAIERGEVFESLKTSFSVAALTSLISCVLGVLSAVALARNRFPGRDLLLNVFMLPLVFPAVMLGILLLQWFHAIGFARGIPALVLGHVLITTPYVIRFVMTSLAGLDPDLEKAAMNLGASPAQAFRRITLPLLAPGVLAGAAVAFIVSFDDVTIAVFLSSARYTTLPVRLYSYVQESFEPLIAATSGLMIFVTVAFVILIERLVGVAKVFVK